MSKLLYNKAKLFDHAAHNGSRYLDGHCFVSLMLCVPVWDNVAPGRARTFPYLSIPLGYRMWQKEKATNSFRFRAIMFPTKI